MKTSSSPQSLVKRRDMNENTNPTPAEGGRPCFVGYPDAEGLCRREAALEVYGLGFCAVHGEEAKLGELTAAL